MSTEPAWVTVGRTYIGRAEIPGPETAPFLRGMLLKLGAWWTDDETPWCGTFVASCLRDAKAGVPKHWYRARGYLDWGSPTSPVIGAIVVYERGASGHVGFAVGRDKAGNILTLGGNQGNRVSIAPFLPSRVLGYRWPLDRLDVPKHPLQTLNSSGAVSSNEA